MKYVFIAVEGETEEELYKNHILPYIKKLLNKQEYGVKFKVHNVRGVGGFKNDSIMKFKEIISKNPDCDEFIVSLCYDTDVFENSFNLPIDWEKVDDKMKKAGADRVIHIKAKKSIEDWLLYALKDICKWLRINVPSNLHGKSGV